MQLVLQALIELEATQAIGAEPYQRSPVKVAQAPARCPSHPHPTGG
jgi:hypothetical protein